MRAQACAAARIAAGRQDRLSLGSLDARRDWGWAPDYVEAMVRAVRHEQADDYVIATGTSHSVAEFVAAAFAAAGIDDWQSRVELDPSFVRPVDAAEQRGDAGKARAVLGWAPTLDFAGIVTAMVEADLAQL
ncbi:MAG TPA: GDP-mannose 4,6-dehydratase [Jatrophihabitans sp.]|nr:GDP-mannose 4,6-dehydratase [Jatrophihabitans sp.]